MKRFLAIALALNSLPLFADEIVIDINALPTKAQTFLATYYPSAKVMIATMERDMFERDYNVILTNGIKVEFDGGGVWREIENRRNGTLSDTMLPQKITQYLRDNHPKALIVNLEQGVRTIEVELNSGEELKFTPSGDLLKVD